MADIKKELNDIKNAVYGREVRGSIHDGIKKINEEVEDSTETSEQAKHQVENIQQQVNQLVVEGDSSVEAAQARVDVNNHAYDTLKQRLDTEYTEVTSQLAHLDEQKAEKYYVDVKKDFGAVGDGVADDTMAIQNAINSIGYGGGEVYFPNGEYRITDTINILNPSISQPRKLKIRGQSYKNVFLILDNDNVDVFLNYDNGANDNSSGTSSHSLEITNIRISHTSESRHIATALNLNGCRFSEFKNIHIGNFYEGIYSFTGWMNRFDTIYIHSCTRGITVIKESYETEFLTPQLYKCGDPITGEGYGMLLRATGGVIIVGLLLEDSRAVGLEINYVRGLTITGGNVESFTDNPAIYIHSQNYSSSLSSGIVIDGVRFWKSRGIRFGRGVDGVDIRSCIFHHPSDQEPSTRIDIDVGNYSDNWKYLKNINYSLCKHDEGFEPQWHTTMSQTTGFTASSFTKEYKRYTNSKPSTYGDGKLNWEENQIVYCARPNTLNCIGWIYANTGNGLEWVEFGGYNMRKMQTINDSNATTIEGLRNDFNTLLGRLKTSGFMS